MIMLALQRKLRSHSGNNQESESEMRTNSSIGNNGNWSLFWHVVLACHLEAGTYHVSGSPGHRFVLACQPWCLVHG